MGGNGSGGGGSIGIQYHNGSSSNTSNDKITVAVIMIATRGSHQTRKRSAFLLASGSSLWDLTLHIGYYDVHHGCLRASA